MRPILTNSSECLLPKGSDPCECLLSLRTSPFSKSPRDDALIGLRDGWNRPECSEFLRDLNDGTEPFLGIPRDG